jgi:hypothetical protein
VGFTLWVVIGKGLHSSPSLSSSVLSVISCSKQLPF